MSKASNGSAVYNNEICSSDNWMLVQGTSWSFINSIGSCSLTNDMNTNNMAMIMYKAWPYLNNAQDPSYTLDIEYNFTITAASGNNTIGSAGILWFFDSQTFDYIGVSFKRNEAFAGVISGIDAKVHYNNLHISFDDSEVIELNRGALPFTLSMGTFYSMRVEVYNIWRGNIRYDIYLNGQYINHFSTYSSAFEQNTSWIGLKNTDAAVISHALTVHQTSTIEDGNAVTHYFASSGAATTTTGIIEAGSIEPTSMTLRPSTTEWDGEVAETPVSQTSSTTMNIHTSYKSNNVVPIALLCITSAIVVLVSVWACVKSYLQRKTKVVDNVRVRDTRHMAKIERVDEDDHMQNAEMTYTVEGPSDHDKDVRCTDVSERTLWNNEVHLVNMLHSTSKPEEVSSNVHTKEVEQWLQSDVHLPEYFDALIKNGYDSMQIIKDISSRNELQVIGIESKQHQLTIMEEIEKWKNKHTRDDTDNFEWNSKKESGGRCEGETAGK